jgi:hypothetical protein
MDLQVHHHIHKRPLLVPIMSQTIQSITPHPISPRSILILSTHLHLELPTGLIPSMFPTNILYACFSFSIHTTCPVHCALLHLIILTKLREECKLRRSSLLIFLQPPVTSSLFGPNILFSTLSAITLSLYYSFNVRDQDSHPCRTTGKIKVLFIPIFTFLDSRQEDRFSGLNGSLDHPISVS